MSDLRYPSCPSDSNQKHKSLHWSSSKLECSFPAEIPATPESIILVRLYACIVFPGQPCHIYLIQHSRVIHRFSEKTVTSPPATACTPLENTTCGVARDALFKLLDQFDRNRYDQMRERAILHQDKMSGLGTTSNTSGIFLDNLIQGHSDQFWYYLQACHLFLSHSPERTVIA